MAPAPVASATAAAASMSARACASAPGTAAQPEVSPMRTLRPQTGRPGLRQRGGERGGVRALRLVVELDGVEAGGGGGADAVEEGQLLVKKAGVGRKAHRPSLSP